MGTVAIMSRVTTSWAKRVQAREDIDKESALSKIAQRIRTGPGTLGNIVRLRVKTACADLRDRWRRAALDDISREIERLQHEYRIVEELAETPDPDDMAALEAAIEEARAVLGRLNDTRKARRVALVQGA